MIKLRILRAKFLRGRLLDEINTEGIKNNFFLIRMNRFLIINLAKYFCIAYSLYFSKAMRMKCVK